MYMGTLSLPKYSIDSYFLGIYHMLRIALDRVKDTGKVNLGRGMSLTFLEQLENKVVGFDTDSECDFSHLGFNKEKIPL